MNQFQQRTSLQLLISMILLTISCMSYAGRDLDLKIFNKTSDNVTIDFSYKEVSERNPEVNQLVIQPNADSGRMHVQGKRYFFSNNGDVYLNVSAGGNKSDQINFYVDNSEWQYRNWSYSFGNYDVFVARKYFSDREELNVYVTKNKDSISVSRMLLIGTHDSATGSYRSFVPFKGAFVKTQIRTIEEQLNEGARFLDIRTGLENSEVKLFHSSYPLGESYEDYALKKAISFLDSHPNEFILFSVKTDHGGDTEVKKLTDQYIANRPERFWTSSSIPSYHDAKGKIILLDRGPLNEGIKIDIDDNNRYSAKDNVLAQDYYEPGIGYSKKAPVIDFFNGPMRDVYRNNAEEQKYKNSFKLNFISASYFPTSDPESYAVSLNPDVRDYLRDRVNSSQSLHGVVIVDYFGQPTPKIMPVEPINFQQFVDDSRILTISNILQ